MTQISDTAIHLANGVTASAARILIVDDEQHMCDVCERTLRSAYDVVATTDAAAALRELHDNLPFDLMLVDIKMPGVSGLDLAKRARELDPAIAVIVMTGHASAENLHQSARRGIADFLSKPFELEDLRTAVDQALHKRQLLQDSLRLRAVEQLLESSEAINATLEAAHLGRIVLDTALSHAPCSVGFLILSDHSQRLNDMLSSDEQWLLSEAGKDAALQSYFSGQPLIIADRGALCTKDTQAIEHGLAMPLRAQGKIVGVLLLCDDQPEALRPGTQEIVALLANQAGTALHNAHLYGELQEAYQRLQELDRLKSEFISIASHELRTPLSIVLGYAMMVRDQSDGDQRAYAQRVLDSAERIKDMVDDMVNLRNLELHEVTLNLEPCELQSLIAWTTERMLPSAQNKAQQVTVNLPHEGIIFLADREKASLVLGNLISNAIKFTAHEGVIEIEAAIWPRNRVLSAIVPASTTRPPSELTEDTWVVVQVRDTGIGIPDRELPHIFDRFYQVAASLTRAHGGSGLGLAIVRDLVDLQGGTLWIESVEGEGSTFSFALPYYPAC